jgi:hypothetical protein
MLFRFFTLVTMYDGSRWLLTFDYDAKEFTKLQKTDPYVAGIQYYQ